MAADEKEKERLTYDRIEMKWKDKDGKIKDHSVYGKRPAKMDGASTFRSYLAAIKHRADKDPSYTFNDWRKKNMNFDAAKLHAVQKKRLKALNDATNAGVKALPVLRTTISEEERAFRATAIDAYDLVKLGIKAKSDFPQKYQDQFAKIEARAAKAKKAAAARAAKKKAKVSKKKK